MRYLLFTLFCLMLGTAQAAPGKAYMSIIIDDLGQSSERDSRTLALPGPVTMAIMPDTPHATEFARQAHKAGRTVILHMPMDPATGPYAWHPGTPIEELARRLDAALAKVPYVAGINNHMGSRMTAQREPMRWLMEELQRRHLFFVDSRTSAATVAAAEAQALGLAHVSRDVFLDDVRTTEAISGQLQLGIAQARKQGSAVLIGHPYPQTLEVLAREIPRLKAQGIELIGLPQMIAERGNQAMPAHGHQGRYSNR
ncbi:MULTISPECIES: divergent polysaccharide deacetylase family protein [unclassified Pseudomonas]|uniref:divergent polysaccharide deacetylase family protein n=1 Tax=unclassified Pseudomonas TaxID=196821 RepID=UPI001944B1E9|nr:MULTISPECIES: divergent polysaccharide deacetylase family protein [unclassified Pseudomonas]MDC0688122.1 divergent polysaccharide deacetylase family protein [Mitsuaria sp. RG]MCE0913293.1 divergent polysaccharide deacetylase family protein [Pseudomonas sp. NMI760_13]MCF1488440.1 divergent polysaccharide deacetylase family protein [Pseudomonas sp. AA27]MCP8636303.1 divergent polysaccharide deacetylase family protein [Pseudomonas sp. DVZ6]MDD7785590.1 divergent polysaccharide deacetylase fami